MQVTDAVAALEPRRRRRVLEISGTEHVIRGRGYVKSAADLEKVVLGSENGTPITLRDVARVQIGPPSAAASPSSTAKARRSARVVIMRYGENALDVIDAVKARLAELAPTLPAGVEVVPTYDRSTLIRASIQTLRHTLIEEMWSWRSSSSCSCCTSAAR